MNSWLRSERALMKIKLKRKQRWVKIIVKYMTERDNEILLIKKSCKLLRKHTIDKWTKDMNKQLLQEEIAIKLLEK